MNTSRVITCLACAACCSLAVVATAQEDGQAPQTGVVIKELYWGFDGTGMRYTFTPLSILVQNNEAKPASGTLRLERLVSYTKRVDVVIEGTYDVPPFEERWVQLSPWLSDGYDTWMLHWGDAAGQSTEVPLPRVTEPAVILLNNPGELPRGVGVIRRFSVDIFPPSVTATDCLGTVVLDSVPDLRGARLQSFLDWLNRGGRVFILHDSQQRFPRFPEALAVLNNSAESFAVGAGGVQRLSIRAAEIDAGLLRTTLKASPPPVRSLRAQTSTDPILQLATRTNWDRDRPILGDLQAASRFSRRWWLIYPLALLYLGSVFPISFAVGRNSPRVIWFYTAYLGSVVLFSLAFITLGRVGAGERNRVRSATLAHSFGDGLYDVSQWLALAPIDGDSFVVTNSGSGRLYASGEDFDTVLGKAVGGTEARLEMDIPPASTRPAMSRFRAAGPKFRFQVLALEMVEDGLEAFSVACEPMPADLRSAVIAYRDHIYPLKLSGTSLVAEPQHGRLTTIYVSGLDGLQPSFGWGRKPPGMDRDERTTDELFGRLDRRLIGNAFGLTHELSALSTTLPEGRARLMLFTDPDPNFRIEGDRFPDQRGCVLYVFDLSLTNP